MSSVIHRRKERLYSILQMLSNGREPFSIVTLFTKDSTKTTAPKQRLERKAIEKDIKVAESILFDYAKAEREKSKDYYYYIALKRYNAQYLESADIDDVKSRLEQQRRITDSYCRITGVEQLSNVVRAVNIFNFFPQDEIIKEFEPKSYHEVMANVEKESEKESTTKENTREKPFLIENNTICGEEEKPLTNHKDILDTNTDINKERIKTKQNLKPRWNKQRLKEAIRLIRRKYCKNSQESRGEQIIRVREMKREIRKLERKYGQVRTALKGV